MPVSTEYHKVAASVKKSRMAVTGSWSFPLDLTVAVVVSTGMSLIHRVLEYLICSLEGAITSLFHW